MTLKQYLFESGSQGTTLTTVNTGASDVNLGSGAGIFDAGVKAHGSLGAKLTSAANSNCVITLLANTASNQMAMSAVFQLPAANDTNTMQPVQVINSAGARVIGLNINGSGQVNPGRMIISDAGNTTSTLVSAGGFTWGAKYRLDLVMTGGSTTAGVLSAKLYDFSAGTQTGNTVSTTTSNLTASTISGAKFGVINTNNGVLTVGVDDVQFNDGASTVPAPVTDTTLTGSANFTDNQTIMAAVPSGGTGPYTYGTPTQTSGPNTTPISLGGGQWVVQKSATTPLIYTIPFTDNLGASGSITATVSPVPAQSVAVWPKRPTGSLPTTVWA